MPEFLKNAFEAEPSMLSVVITGLVIVFGMLLLFVLLFGVFGKLMSAISNTGKSKTTNSATLKSDPAPIANPSASAVSSVSQDNDELIAVISAAVYAMYEGNGKRPVIKSIRPASQSGKSSWAMAGIYNNIKSF